MNETRKLRFCGFNIFELALILIVVGISALFLYQASVPAIPASDWEAIGFATTDFVAAFCGICSVVLCAKGKRSGFIFGFVNVIGYAFISYHNAYYGEVMLNVLFYIPANIVSYIVWTKNKDHERNDLEVKARSLSGVQLTISLIVIAAVTFAYHFLLEVLGGSMTMLDGTTTVLSIFATILMALRYSEQWLFWIIVDILTVALWVVAGNPVMIAMWAAYLVNAFYGYLMWLNKSGRNVPFKKLLDKAAN